MLDMKLLRKNREAVEKKLKTKEPAVDLAPILELDQKVRNQIQELEELKATRNKLSQEIGEEKKKGQESELLKEKVKTINDKSHQLSEQLKENETQLFQLLAELPNIPADEVKISLNKEDNEVIKIVGEKPSFAFPYKHHLELNEKLHLFDFVRAAKITGSNWPCYRGKGAELEWALINYFLEIQQIKGFEFWLPPFLVRPEMMVGSGQMPKFKGQYYETIDDKHPLTLLPTAEVALNALHSEEIFSAKDLPLKYCAYSPCFRKEAGALGAQERGLIRMHQFNKVEMFCFATHEQSEALFHEMIAICEEILLGLNLHYRITRLVTGDMSFTAAKTVDIEVWLPGQNRYMEVSSVSHCTDFQSRRSNIRYRDDQKLQLVHTLNGSGLATPRLMVALLESNQDKNGDIILPPLLADKLKRDRL